MAPDPSSSPPDAAAAPEARWVLGFDTSTPLASLALLERRAPGDGGAGASVKLMGARQVRARVGHGETLLPHVDALLSAAEGDSGAGAPSSSRLSQVALVVVGLGPGSFTGTRIGVALAKGMALAAGVPVVGLSSLEVLAFSALGVRQPSSAAALAGAVTRAAKGRAFGALYAFSSPGHAGDPILPPLVGAPEAVVARISNAAGSRAFVLGGDVAEAGIRVPQAPAAEVSWLHATPSAATLAFLGLARFEAHGADDVDALEPLYVVSADTLPAKGQ